MRGIGHRAMRVVGILGLLAVSACGGGTQTSSGGSTASDTTGTSASAAKTSSSSSPTSGSTDSNDGLAWVPFGPNDPDFPTPGWDVYYYFTAHDCDKLQNDVQQKTGNLYKSAVAICYAAVKGQQSQWDVANNAFNARTADDAIGPAQCVDDTIATVVAALLAWHEQHPGRQPVLTFPETTDKRTACSRDHNSFGESSSSTTESTATSSTSTSSVTSSTSSATSTATSPSR